MTIKTGGVHGRYGVHWEKCYAFVEVVFIRRASVHLEKWYSLKSSCTLGKVCSLGGGDAL